MRDGRRPAPRFHAAVAPGEPLRLRLSEDGGWTREYLLPDRSHAAFLRLRAAMATDFELGEPHAPPAPRPDQEGLLRPVLTAPVAAGILYGYGDPCVVQVGKADYRLLVTSNDALDAFPILSSPDLEAWRLSGFVFPAGSAPPWALTGPEVSDFWAPELHRVAGEWLVCFSARTPRRDLAIGLARAASPDGPFVADPEPLIGGGVIDPHILVDAEDRAWLIWKRDDNGRWPPALMNLLADQPWLGPALFAPADARMAAALLALWPWASSLEPMQQFFLLQPLIEAVSDDLDGFGERLRGLLPGLARSALGFAGAILAALRTPIFAQPLSKDGRSLEGEPTVILQNDAPWEGHLVEGVWVSRQGERYYLLYAGNDFSTSKYAIGVAVAERPCGPYRKASDALLQSTARWQGPGHPSVVRAPDGELRMFLHAFPPGEAGYKAFRALLSTPIRLADGVVSAGDPPDGGPPPEP